MCRCVCAWTALLALLLWRNTFNVERCCYILSALRVLALVAEWDFFFAASCFCFLYKFACLSICWLLACLLCHVWHMTAWCVKVFIGYSVAANGAALPFRAWVERAYNNNDNNNKWEACSRTCYTLMLESIGSEQ